MLALRSLVFNTLFYLYLIGIMIVGLPALLIGRRAILVLADYWGRGSLWLMRVVCHTEVEFRGLEHIPLEPCIIAAKHQSLWDVFAFLRFFRNFTVILKRELAWIPLFGWYVLRADLIAINRSKGTAALNEAKQGAKKGFEQGQSLLMFPEGTRRPAGTEPNYKFGVAHIYADNHVPCLPIAHNSGLFWARRSFIRRPGKILVQFLPVIEPGLDRKVFFARLQAELETATNALIAETLKSNPELRSVLPESYSPSGSKSGES
jgi:1-acyl-sn-glycerol-3-phosphate acyltransferase